MFAPHLNLELDVSNASLQVGNRATLLYDGEPELQLAYSPVFTVISFFVPIFVLLGAYSLAGTGEDGSKIRVISGGVFAGSRFVARHPAWRHIAVPNAPVPAREYAPSRTNIGTKNDMTVNTGL